MIITDGYDLQKEDKYRKIMNDWNELIINNEPGKG